LHSQRLAQVPPIPVQEQFVGRNELSATLRLVTDRVQIDERPKAKLIFKNVGTRRLLIRRPTPHSEIGRNPDVHVYTVSGERLYETLVAMCRCVYGIRSIREMVALEPQQ
jgi:hypothetical protein